MTIEYMTRFAEEWLEENYGLDLNIPIKINNRLSRTLGSFSYNPYSKRAVKIDISGKFIKYNSKEDVLMTLKHELVHYALFMLGKPHRDGMAYFENELLKHGLDSNYRKSSRNIKIPKHTYQCNDCNKVIEVNKRINVSRKMYVCKCGGDWIHLGQF